MYSMKSSDDSLDLRSTLWRKNDSVPGRPVSSHVHSAVTRTTSNYSPRKEASKSKHKKNLSCTSFQDFQESTNDAWDVGDDDVCIVSDIMIHPKVAQSTAMKVINNHKKDNLLPAVSTPEETEKEKPNHNASESKTVAMQRLASQKELSKPPERANAHHCHGGSIPAPGIGVRQSRSNVSAYSLLPKTRKSSGSSEREAELLEKFNSLLNSPNTDLEELKKLSWMGIPYKVRPITWKLISGYLHPNPEKRESRLRNKREEYSGFLTKYYECRNEDIHQETYRQIHIDVPRMSPLVPLFQQEIVQQSFERILYIWAIRHPASGYVQGMNDLVTPFFVVFLQEFISSELEVETFDVSQLRSDQLQQVEADSYFCMAHLLASIQDNYTFAQPGIQKKVKLLKELMQRIDAPLHNHLERHTVEYLQFSFRWMNNLLMRELPLRCTIRLWDTYLSEENGFNSFHLYVCAAFLKHWSYELLLEKDFQGLMLKLQNLPTLHWDDKQIELLVADAYRLKYMFDDAPNHLQPKS